MGQGSLVFDDNFVKPSSLWTFTDGETGSSFARDGNYFFENISPNKSLLFYLNLQPFPFEDNFRLETEITLEEYEGNFGCGMLWGSKNGENFFAFSVSPNGMFIIDGNESGKYVKIKEWTKSQLIRPVGQPNVLAIEKSGGNLRFFINGGEVHKDIYREPFGGKSGFYLGVKRKAKASYFKVWHQPVPPTNAPLPTDVLFEDHFDTEEMLWLINDTENISSNISDGYYKLENRNEKSGWLFFNELPLDPGEDFIIESEITLLEETGRYSCGIVWNTKDGNNYHSFAASSSGRFIVSFARAGQIGYMKRWTSHTAVNGLGQPNIFRIEQRGRLLLFFLNGQEVYKSGTLTPAGNFLGFYVGPSRKVQANYFKVIQKKPKLNIAEGFELTGKKESLGTNINTPYDDMAPVVSQDGNTLYFLRKKHPGNLGEDQKDDIWFATKQADGQWSKAANIGRPLNNDGHNFVISVTPDHNTMLLSNTYNDDGSSKGAGVSISHRTSSGWEIPRPLTIKDYYNHSEYVSYCLSPNRKALLVSAERDEGYGSRDLYVCFLENDGSWSRPKNLGPTVNSQATDFAPFLAADNATLYYSSYGKPGYGSADIFITKRLDDTWENWSEPQNLGPQINTNGWDAYFTLDALGQYAYLVSTQNSIGKADIFRIKMPDNARPGPVVIVQGTVYDASTKKPMSANIVYEDLGIYAEAGIAQSDPLTGSYKIALPAGVLYGFRAEAGNYLPYNENLDTKTVTGYTEINRDLYLTPIRKGLSAKLNNMFFVRASAELLPASYLELDRLIGIMKAHPALEVEIQGHTDGLGNPETLQKLSEERAAKITAYLIDHGIAPRRLASKGYGGLQPVASNNTEESRQLNRRVEVKIVNN